MDADRNFQGLPDEEEEVSSRRRRLGKQKIQDQSTAAERSMFEDLRNFVQHSPVLSSVRFYTFKNITNYGLICSSISQDGSLVAGGFNDSTIKVWNMPKAEQLPGSSDLQGENKSYTLLQGHRGPVHSTTFSPQGDLMLSASADSTILLWSTQWNTLWNTDPVCYRGPNYPNAVWDVKFSPDGLYFASSSHDKTARVWEAHRIHPFKILEGHPSSVDRVEWHPNGKCIATASDKTIHLWDVSSTSRKCVTTFTGHKSMIFSLAISPDGRYMASGDEDGAIQMWDVGTGRCITPLLEHTSRVSTLGFSCEGSVLASGSSDCSIKLWDVNTSVKPPQAEEENVGMSSPNALATLRTWATPVQTLKLSPRNNLFAAGPLS